MLHFVIINYSNVDAHKNKCSTYCLKLIVNTVLYKSMKTVERSNFRVFSSLFVPFIMKNMQVIIYVLLLGLF